MSSSVASACAATGGFLSAADTMGCLSGGGFKGCPPRGSATQRGSGSRGVGFWNCKGGRGRAGGGVGSARDHTAGASAFVHVGVSALVGCVCALA
jgi:hypothetical protein